MTLFPLARYRPIASLLVRGYLQSRRGVGDREEFGLEAPAAGPCVIQDFDAADDGPLVPGKRQWEIVVVFARDRVYRPVSVAGRHPSPVVFHPDGKRGGLTYVLRPAGDLEVSGPIGFECLVG